MQKGFLCICRFSSTYLPDLKDQSFESFPVLFFPQFSYLLSAEFFMLFLERLLDALLDALLEEFFWLLL